MLTVTPTPRDLFIKEEISAHLRCNIHVRDHWDQWSLWVLLNQ
jgi:hypothetical protein